MAKKKEIKETETTVTEQEPEKEEKKNNKGLIFLLIGLLVIAAVAGTLFFLNAKVTVTFDSDGGSAVAAEKVKKGECVNQPGDPTKEGFDFMGWYLGDQKYDFATPVTNSITIKAGWEKSKYVTFLVDGKEYAKEHIVNGKITFPENPTMDGFAFIEWQKGAGEAISESDVFDQDLTDLVKDNHGGSIDRAADHKSDDGDKNDHDGRGKIIPALDAVDRFEDDVISRDERRQGQENDLDDGRHADGSGYRKNDRGDNKSDDKRTFGHFSGLYLICFRAFFKI